MEIAYVVNPRPDTGLWNAKIAIWLFIASEVMLFGGLFSAYVFLRIGAAPGMWPHGLMNVPIGTFNTIILITSSITAVFAWAAVKMRQFAKYKFYMGLTILLGLAFLCIKLGYEYPQKFEHFGAYIKQDSLPKYEAYLGNKYLSDKGLAPRYEISGHLEKITIDRTDADAAALDAIITNIDRRSKEPSELQGNIETIKLNSQGDYYAIKNALGAVTNPEEKDPQKIVRKPDGVEIESYVIAVDPVNADPTNPDNDRPHFLYRTHTDKEVTVSAADVDFASMFIPKHSTFLAIYYVITMLHALHIVGGLIVFTYFFLPIGTALYKTNPEHFSNRIEVACIYWHFVDLVWIFAFPVFYLL
jgi:cytochrome c oxidase subunit 3